MKYILRILYFFMFFFYLISNMVSAQTVHRLSLDDYQDRVHAVWAGQIAGTLLAWPFEHQTASVEWIDHYPRVWKQAPVDDDWYYEIVALRAFEKYGVGLTLAQLGKQWQENACGSWGSSEQARLLMARGVDPAMVGHPRYNRLWFTIGPQFSADIYGALAPGMPNVAGQIARDLCHINGYAEGADGGVFIAAMVSLGFIENDPKEIVRKAAQLIDPRSPYRECLDMVIQLAEQGHTAREIFDAIENRWHIEYPATNNAVANGGIVAASVWLGSGDFLKTINLAASAADFTDADCNAANAAAVVGAMKGMKGIPGYLVEGLNDRIKGSKMGGVILTPPVDERISDLARRTALMGQKIIEKNGGMISNSYVVIPYQQPKTQAAELFRLADLTQFWNPDWKLDRAGFGGAGGGMRGIRGITYLDGDILATYPRDEVRAVLLSRTLDIQGQQTLLFEAGADSKRSWQLQVYVNNKRELDTLIEGNSQAVQWYPIRVNLESYQGQKVTLRLYQRVLIDGREAGNAYWRHLRIE